jgi:NADH:ubiquinone oxidoreductase subunit F (NADH-binding)
MTTGLRAFLILEGIIIAALLLYLAAGAYVQ